MGRKNKPPLPFYGSVLRIELSSTLVKTNRVAFIFVLGKKKSKGEGSVPNDDWKNFPQGEFFLKFSCQCPEFLKSLYHKKSLRSIKGAVHGFI